MNCPRCSILSPSDSPECGTCGFTATAAEQKMGMHAVIVHRLVDTAHVLRLRDSMRIEGLVDEFERRFPQVYCTVFLGVLPADVSVAEGGFWLLNHAVRTCQGEVRDNCYGIALIIDPSTHTAGLCLGYGIEAAVSSLQAEEALRRATASLWHGDYFRAVACIVGRLDKWLRKYGKSRHRPPPSESGLASTPLPGFERAEPDAAAESSTARAGLP